MGSGKRKQKGHGRGQPPGYAALLIVDRQEPEAGVRATAWMTRHLVSFGRGWSQVLPDCRFVLVGKCGRRPPIVEGRHSLDQLVNRAWPILAGRALGDRGGFDALLSSGDAALLREWLTSPAPPPVGDRPVVAGAGHGRFEFRADKPNAVGLQGVRKVMRSIRDALLDACGIVPPASTADSDKAHSGPDGSMMVWLDSCVASDAQVEHALGGFFVEGDAASTIVTGAYALPYAGSRCLVSLGVKFAKVLPPEGSLEEVVERFEVAEVMVCWQGLEREDAVQLAGVVTQTMEHAGAGGGWRTSVDDTGPFDIAGRAALANVDHVEEKMRGLIVAAQACGKQLADAGDRLKRAEQRHSDREADLEAQRDVAQASLERERTRMRPLLDAMVKELTAMGVVAAPGALAQGSPSSRVDAGAADEALRLDRDAWQAKAEDRTEEVDALRQELHLVRAERDAAIAVVPVSDRDALVDVRQPESLVELGGWANRSLNGRVVVIPRALRAARKSCFANPSLVYRVLEAMRDDYWAMKFAPGNGAQSHWDQFLKREHLSCGPTGAGPESRLSDTYHASWDGRRVPMDMHLQGHSGRDEARQFRLYFHVDEGHRQLIVGHLPSHLRNRES